MTWQSMGQCIVCRWAGTNRHVSQYCGDYRQVRCALASGLCPAEVQLSEPSYTMKIFKAWVSIRKPVAFTDFLFEIRIHKRKRSQLKNDSYESYVKKIQQSGQTSALAMHLPLAHLVSMSVIFCLLPSSSIVIFAFYLFSTDISEQHVWELWDSVSVNTLHWFVASSSGNHSE